MQEIDYLRLNALAICELHIGNDDPEVRRSSSWIQGAAFIGNSL